jgi:hypothetical protein
MKSTVFDLKYPPNGPSWGESGTAEFPIPTLKAYAIEYSEFKVKGSLGEHKEMVEGQDYKLTESGLLWHRAFGPMLPGMDYYRLVIHYHGIRDHALLFPYIKNSDLQHRLGQFYEESEVSFENGAWLAFALLSGAIYEGMLFDFDEGKDETFSELISRGKEKEILDEFSAGIMNQTRELRNLVHPGRAGEPFVTRAQAMDMRKVLDRLIKQATDWR